MVIGRLLLLLQEALLIILLQPLSDWISASQIVRLPQQMEKRNGIGNEWSLHRKHFLVLSSSGKPIYSRYGDESDHSSIMALIQAFLSVFLQDQDPLRYIRVC